MDLFTFETLSWIGVILLMLAHIAVARGKAKKSASLASAAGALISATASAGMGIWSVCVLNVVWFGISLMGSKVAEDKRPLPFGLWSVRACALLSILAWALGPQAVAWLGTATYLIGWFAFSVGWIRRHDYLVSCLVAGASVVPALILLDAHAFALNETFGAIVSAMAIASTLRRDALTEQPGAT